MDTSVLPCKIQSPSCSTPLKYTLQLENLDPLSLNRLWNAPVYWIFKGVSCSKETLPSSDPGFGTSRCRLHLGPSCVDVSSGEIWVDAGEVSSVASVGYLPQCLGVRFWGIEKSEDEKLKVGDLPMKYEKCLHSWWLKTRNRRSYDPKSQFPNLLRSDLIVERYFVLLIFGLLKSSSNPGSFAENESVVVSLTILEADTCLNRK